MTKMDINLIPYEKNAKLHNEKQLLLLAEIVKEVGWRQNVLVNKDRVIIAGHGRYASWKKYRESHSLPDIWITNDKGETLFGELDTRPMTDEQEAMYRLADNKSNESEWDMKLAVEELKGLSEDMFNLTGFDNDLLLEDDDKDDLAPELPETPQSEVGDVYILGEHRIMCGDSTSAEHVATLMNDHKADLVFTDPPYNINYKGQGKNTSNTIMADNVLADEFDSFLDKVFQRYSENAKPGAGVYCFHAAKTASQFEKALILNGYEIKNQLIWNKPTAGLGMGDYRWKHEPFFYANKKGQKVQFYGDRTHSTVWDFQKSEEELVRWAKKQKRLEQSGGMSIWSMKRDSVQEYVHPTQKPVELITYALKNNTKAGDIVMDLFLGSGSTMIAADKTGRVCYGMDLDPRYVDVAIKRWMQFTDTQEIIKNGRKYIWE